MKGLHITLFTILLLASGSLNLKAQDNGLMVGVRAGHNASFGGFAAVSVEAHQNICGDFFIDAGLQYNTIGKTTVEAVPAYGHQFDWGELSVESVLSYTRMTSVNSIAAGAGVAVDSRSVSGRLGYYYRHFGGQGGWINEPFNVYYELSIHFLKKIEDWKLDFVITNCEAFELERHFQPSFIAEGSYFPTSKLGISFGIGCKPSGMFNMSADYYQTYIKTGVCYRW